MQITVTNPTPRSCADLVDAVTNNKITVSQEAKQIAIQLPQVVPIVTHKLVGYSGGELARFANTRTITSDEVLDAGSRFNMFHLTIESIFLFAEQFDFKGELAARLQGKTWIIFTHTILHEARFYFMALRKLNNAWHLRPYLVDTENGPHAWPVDKSMFFYEDIPLELHRQVQQ